MAQIPRVVCGELSWVWGNGGIVRMQTLDEKKKKKRKRVDETLWDTEWIWICAVCCLGCSSDLVSFTWVTTHPCMFLNWSRDQFDTRPWSAIRRHNVAHGMIETD